MKKTYDHKLLQRVVTLLLSEFESLGIIPTGLYLVGSYARGDQRFHSDIDILFIVKETGKRLDRDRILKIRRLASDTAGRCIDISMIPEEDCLNGVRKCHEIRLLLHGDDILSKCKKLGILHELFYGARSVAYLGAAIRGGKKLTLPVAPPHEAGRFKGYERYGYQYMPGMYRPGFLLLYNYIASIATLELAHSKSYVPTSKHEAIEICSSEHSGIRNLTLIKNASILTHWLTTLPDNEINITALMALCDSVNTLEDQGLELAVKITMNQAENHDRLMAKLTAQLYNIVCH